MNDALGRFQNADLTLIPRNRKCLLLKERILGHTVPGQRSHMRFEKNKHDFTMAYTHYAWPGASYTRFFTYHLIHPLFYVVMHLVA